MFDQDLFNKVQNSIYLLSLLFPLLTRLITGSIFDFMVTISQFRLSKSYACVLYEYTLSDLSEHAC